MADLDSGRGGSTPAAFAVEVAMATEEVAVPVESQSHDAGAGSGICRSNMSSALVLHRTSPGSEALMRHSARVPTD